MEHVCCRQKRLPVLVKLDVTSEDVSVSSEYLFSVRVPYYELLVWVLHGVELVDVNGEAASSAGIAECLLAETAYFFHDIRGVMMIDHIDLVVALVGVSQLFRWCQL